MELLATLSITATLPIEQKEYLLGFFASAAAERAENRSWRQRTAG